MQFSTCYKINMVYYYTFTEKKLTKVQKGIAKKEQSTASSFINSLSQTRESCMVKLLSDSAYEVNRSVEEFLSDEVKVNLLLKKLAPEKQAISTEELVHLLKADQLQLLITSESETPTTDTEEEIQLAPSSSQKTEVVEKDPTESEEGSKSTNIC